MVTFALDRGSIPTNLATVLAENLIIVQFDKVMLALDLFGLGLATTLSGHMSSPLARHSSTYIQVEEDDAPTPGDS